MSKSKTKSLLKRRPTQQLSDGTIGYFMLPGRKDDCFRASIATVLQVPPDEIPDPQLERRLRAGHDPAVVASQSWARLHDWLHSRGLRIVHHKTEPPLADRWVGVCPGLGAEVGIAELAEVVADWPRAARRRELQASSLKRYARRFEHFCDHCLVMAGGGRASTILFDPARELEAPPDLEARVWEECDVAWGFSFEPIQGDG